jgi:hypothetical protein
MRWLIASARAGHAGLEHRFQDAGAGVFKKPGDAATTFAL